MAGFRFAAVGLLGVGTAVEGGGAGQEGGGGGGCWSGEKGG